LDIEEFRTPLFSAVNMFAVVPMDVPSTHIKTFKENTDYLMAQTLTHQQTISKLTIHWYDKDLKPLNFQGFENNSFLLRVYTDRVMTANPEQEAERKTIDEYIEEIKVRLAEEEAAQKKAEAMKKKVTFGKWAFFLAILGVLVVWYFTKKTM
jgi:hypothetical protein